MVVLHSIFARYLFGSNLKDSYCFVFTQMCEWIFPKKLKCNDFTLSSLSIYALFHVKKSQYCLIQCVN